MLLVAGSSIAKYCPIMPYEVHNAPYRADYIYKTLNCKFIVLLLKGRLCFAFDVPLSCCLLEGLF